MGNIDAPDADEEENERVLILMKFVPSTLYCNKPEFGPSVDLL